MQISSINETIGRALVLLSLAPILLLAAANAQQPSSGKPKQIPPPFETIKNTKEFNAVSFGPGNTFSIAKTPPEFQLNEFAISADGRLLAMGWGSGKIDLWDLHSRKRIGDFKSEVGAPGVMKFNENQLVVTGSGGKVAFLDLPKGKKLRSLVIPLGKYKYDLQQLVFDPNLKWMAYADEESSKVLDISSDPPKQIADLKDAGSIALSQDGSELWTVNRNELIGYRTATWEMIGNWSHKGSPIKTTSTLVRTGVTPEGSRTVAVPSENGLVVYREPEMKGEFVTGKPTSAVVYIPANKSYLNLAAEMTFVSADGNVLCRRSYKGRSGYAVSEDGQWLAFSQSNSVDLWRMEDLLRDCQSGQ